MGLLAAQSLKALGYNQIISMSGGFRDWSDAGNPIAKPVAMTAEQLERYSRHFMLREIGEDGQAKLLSSRVLLIGAGGLGSPAGVYLAAAGVGTLGVRKNKKRKKKRKRRARKKKEEQKRKINNNKKGKEKLE